MIEQARGNLLEADAEALVNTVNTVGVMGKGIALQFRRAFPKNYDFYRKACEHHEVQPGRMLVFATGRFDNPKYIINFPTKRHWKENSRLEDIEAGLNDLVRVIRELGISSLALPPLGAGNGGLDWADVRPRIVAALTPLNNVRVHLYAPSGTPPADSMPVGTNRPRMTAGRAAFIGAMRNYVIPGFYLTLLEVQKLACFLQFAGEPLRLRFVRGPYGPYAENLNHVLKDMEGHFIRGFGDGSRRPDVPIRLLPGSEEEADAFLADHPETAARQERVKRLIDGFETPYGMEMLATVLWLAHEKPELVTDSSAMISAFQAWSPRKLKIFEPKHIEIALAHLRQEGWLESVPSSDAKDT